MPHKNTEVENAPTIQIIKIIDTSNEPGSDEGINCHNFFLNFDCFKYLMSMITNYTKMKAMLAANSQC